MAVFSSVSEYHQLKLRHVLRTGHLQTFGGFLCFCFGQNPPQKGKVNFKKASLSSQRWCHGALHSREPDTSALLLRAGVEPNPGPNSRPALVTHDWTARTTHSLLRPFDSLTAAHLTNSNHGHTAQLPTAPQLPPRFWTGM